MNAPNLFAFATSELSLDAFVCWLASWADPRVAVLNPTLHATAVNFVTRLIEVGAGAVPPSMIEIKALKQVKDIDVLLMVNDDIAVIIEDKTGTQDHSDQLRRYKEWVQAKFPDRKCIGVYLKTGDQSDYTRIQNAGYGCFLRKDFLAVLDQGADAGVQNHIYADFRSHLRKIETAVQSYATVRIADWDSDDDRAHRWAGFFIALKERLGEGKWQYVPNPSGGFMGFHWQWRDGRFLQLEGKKLCFKLEVAEKAEQTKRWQQWHNALFASVVPGGIRLTRPVRRAGTWMTVAVLEGGYLQTLEDGTLDMESTLQVLQRAMALMDAAVVKESERSIETPP